MPATGMRNPLGLKIAGPNVQGIQELGTRVEELLRKISGTRSVFAERMNDGRYIDIQWDRGELARAALSMEEAQMAVQSAIGGDNITTIIHGRARYPVNVRLPRVARDNLDALRQVLVGGSGNTDPVPLGQLASVRIVPRPAMIRDENAMLTGYVYLDLDGRDPGDDIREAADVLARKLSLPAGYTLS
jgi:copper/silver efflux system protein